MNDPRLIPFREYMRRSRPWWWWLNPWGYADALEIIQAEAFRAAAGPEAPPPTSDAVRCAWCGAALAQDPDAPHRWRCDRAVQGKCVARGYWYVLCDDLAGVREAALVTDTAGTPSDAVREAAEAIARRLFGSREHVALWDAINEFREAPNLIAREHAVVRVEDGLRAVILAALASSPATLATVTAPTSPTSDAKWLRVWPYGDGPDHSCAIEFLVSGTQYDAIEVPPPPGAAGPEAPPPPSDAVREAAEVVRTILTAHDARLSESGVLTYGPPSKGTGFVAAIQWLRRYDAARGGE